MIRCHRTIPRAALPSLSMVTSATDPNRGAAAPHEPNRGARRLSLRALLLVPLFGAPKWCSSEYWEMGGAPDLDGRHLASRRNNQPNDGVGGGGSLERWFKWAERVGEDVCSSFWVANGAKKIIKIERENGASNFDGSCWMVWPDNQPKNNHIVGIYLGEAAHRAVAIGEDAVESFRPSDFGQKNE